MADVTILMISNPNDPENRSYHLEVRYSGGLARIELPVRDDTPPAKDGIEACRTELLELLEAVRHATLYPQHIHWPYPQKDE